MQSNRRLNPAHLEQVKRLADNSPFLGLLGVKLFVFNMASSFSV